MKDFVNYLKAGYPALWIQTSEDSRAVATLASQAREKGFKTYAWDCQAGIREIGNGYSKQEPDPLAAVKFLLGREEKSIIFLYNFHKFVKSIEVIQEIQNCVRLYKTQQKSVIVVSPSAEIPIELEKIFFLSSFELPRKEELKKVLEEILDSANLTHTIKENEKDEIIEAGKGLSEFEFENAIALAIVSRQKNIKDIVLEQKKQIVKKNAGLLIENNEEETMANLGGLENLKNFCMKVANSPLSRGVLLLGVPGTGKSHFSKALGNELGLPTAALDFGRMFGSLVGESEERMRSALQTIDAFSPCILRIDEIEKGLSGIKSSSQTDGGTGSRVFGTFLNWMQDHRSRVFVIATCNDISQMPPEFLRAERWDAIFFVDLPNQREREVIFKIYQNFYGVKGSVKDVSMDGWSGAEIKSLCRIAAMMQCELREAAKYVVPLSLSMQEKIESLREWAKTRTIPASGEVNIEKPKTRRLEQ